MRERLLLEGALQVRSRWTVFCAAAVIVFAVGSVYLASSLFQSTAPVQLQETHGAGFAEWLATAEEAAMIRNDLASLQPGMTPNLALTMLAAIGPLIAVVWGASVIGIEFSRNTVRTRAAHIGWARSVQAKTVVIITGAIATALIVPLVGLVAGLVSWQLLAGSFSWILDAPRAVPPAIIPGIIVTAAGLAFYGLLAGLITLSTKSLPVGIIGGLAVPYIESFVGRWWLPQSAYGSLLQSSLAYFPGTLVAPPPVVSQPPVWWASWVVLTLWFALVVWALRQIAAVQEIP